MKEISKDVLNLADDLIDAVITKGVKDGVLPRDNVEREYLFDVSNQWAVIATNLAILFAQQLESNKYSGFHRAIPKK